MTERLTNRSTYTRRDRLTKLYYLWIAPLCCDISFFYKYCYNQILNINKIPQSPSTENLVVWKYKNEKTDKLKMIFIKMKNYNHFHNILRLFDVLPNFLFTTSETMHDYYL